MRRTMLVFICIVLPLLAFAGSHSIFKPNQNGSIPESAFRGYRLYEQIESYKNGSLWEASTKYRHHYPNANTDQADSLYHYEWDIQTLEWQQSMYSNYTYNGAGRVVGLDTYMQVMPGMIILVNSTQSVYDNQNRLTHYTMNMFNFEDFSLSPFMRLHIGYANNNITSIAGWAREDEIPYWVSTFQHDAQGRVILETEQSSPDSSNWVNSYKTETTYHPNDNTNAAANIEFVATFYPATFGQSLRMFPGMPQQYLTYSWNGTNWELSERETLNWDSSNNHLLNILEEYRSGEAWAPTYKEEYSYDGHHNVAQVIGSEHANSAWDETDKQELSWNSYGSANEDFNSPALADLQLSIYPSPFAERVSISPLSNKSGTIKVDIYNLKGQQIQQFHTLPSSTITWDGKDQRGLDCANGIYFLRAEQNGSSQSARIMKLK